MPSGISDMRFFCVSIASIVPLLHSHSCSGLPGLQGLQGQGLGLIKLEA